MQNKFIVLFVFGILTLSAFGSSGFSPMVSNPTTINNITLNQNYGVPGDVITGSIDVSYNDTLSYEYLLLAHINTTSGGWDFIEWIYVNSSLNFQFNVESYWPSGEFLFQKVEIHQVNIAYETFANGTDFTSPTFTVANTTYDANPPVLLSIYTDSSTYYPGDIANIYLLVNETNPATYLSNYLNWWNGTTWETNKYMIFYFNQTMSDGSQRYKGSFQISNFTKPGSYGFPTFTLYDLGNNYKQYFNNTDYIFRFDVAGTILDTQAPAFVSIDQPYPIMPGRNNGLFLNINETQSGLDYGQAKFENANGSYFWVYFNPSDNQVASANFYLENYQDLGKYDLTYFYMVDYAGNSVEYTTNVFNVSIDVVQYVPPSISISLTKNSTDTNYVHGILVFQNTLGVNGGNAELRINNTIGDTVSYPYVTLSPLNATALQFDININDYGYIENGSILYVNYVNMENDFGYYSYFYNHQDFNSPTYVIIQPRIFTSAHFTNSFVYIGEYLTFTVESNSSDFNYFELSTLITKNDGSSFTNYYYGYKVYNNTYSTEFYLDAASFISVSKISVNYLNIYTYSGKWIYFNASQLNAPNEVEVRHGNFGIDIKPVNGSIIRDASVPLDLTVFSNFTYGQNINVEVQITDPDGNNNSLYYYGQWIDAFLSVNFKDQISFPMNGNYEVRIKIKTEYGLFFSFILQWTVDAVIPTTSTTTSTTPTNISSTPTSSDTNVTGPPTLENPLPGFELGLTLFSVIIAFVAIDRRRKMN